MLFFKLGFTVFPLRFFSSSSFFLCKIYSCHLHQSNRVQPKRSILCHFQQKENLFRSFLFLFFFWNVYVFMEAYSLQTNCSLLHSYLICEIKEIPFPIYVCIVFPIKCPFYNIISSFYYK